MSLMSTSEARGPSVMHVLASSGLYLIRLALYLLLTVRSGLVLRYKDLLPKNIATRIICQFRLLPGNKVSAIQRGVAMRMDEVR